MGPDSSRLTAQDSSARGGRPCGDWPARRRATRVHFTASSRRRALSLPTPGTPLPTAAISEATARKDTVYTRHSLRWSSATSARLYFRLEGGLKQPIPARSGRASPAPEVRRVSSGRGNSPAPQSAEAGPGPRGLRPWAEGSTSPSCLSGAPLLFAASAGSSPSQPQHLFRSGSLPSRCPLHSSRAQSACPQSHRPQLPPRLQRPSTGVGGEASLEGRQSQP